MRVFTAAMQSARLAEVRPLLVHHPDFERVGLEPEQAFHRVEQIVGEGDLPRTVHLELHDIDRVRLAC